MRVSTAVIFVLSIFLSAGLHAQPPAPPPPPPPPPQDLQHRIRDIGEHLRYLHPINSEQQHLAEDARRYLGEAMKAARNKEPYVAARFADAADACRRALEHLTGGPGAPPPPPPPPLSDHLRNVYFRLRMCDFFMKQIPEPKPEDLLAQARVFYRYALEDMQKGKNREADAYASSADDLTHAIEAIAQAFAPAPPAAPARRLPPGTKGPRQ
jgi:hypothetical protein